MEDLTVHDFVGALSKLSLEMVPMRSCTDVGTSAGTDTIDKI